METIQKSDYELMKFEALVYGNFHDKNPQLIKHLIDGKNIQEIINEEIILLKEKYIEVAFSSSLVDDKYDFFRRRVLRLHSMKKELDIVLSRLFVSLISEGADSEYFNQYNNLYLAQKGSADLINMILNDLHITFSNSDRKLIKGIKSKHSYLGIDEVEGLHKTYMNYVLKGKKKFKINGFVFKLPILSMSLSAHRFFGTTSMKEKTDFVLDQNISFSRLVDFSKLSIESLKMSSNINDIEHLKKIETKLNLILNSDDNEKVKQDEFLRFLIEINLIPHVVINYYKSKIKDEVSNCKSDKESSKMVKLYLDKFEDYKNNPKFIEYRMSDILIDSENSIDELIEYFNLKNNVETNSLKENNVDKIRTKMTATQLGLLFRLLYDEGLIDEKVEHLLKKIATSFSSVTKDDLSTSSFNKGYYLTHKKSFDDLSFFNTIFFNIKGTINKLSK